MAFSPRNMFTKFFRPFTTAGVSMRAVGAEAGGSYPDGSERATIAAGCFWGPEHIYRKNYGNKGLIDAKVGYIGGDTKAPSYRTVCSGRTGHAEALQIIFNPQQVSYRELLEFFYKMHDPTTKDRQGPDTGTQYRSAIFTHNDEQAQIAKDVTEKVNQEWWKGGVTTQVVPAAEWWEAEEYHQEYHDRNPMGYECPSHFIRSFPSLSS